VDGNAVFLSGLNHNNTISHSDFVWIGDSAIAAWGYTRSDNEAMPAGTGDDGTNGNQPRGTKVLRNTMHELGTNQKQSSPWFQAKSCQNHIEGNLMYNLPRAAINFNDGK
jgi:hypothetical protein